MDDSRSAALGLWSRLISGESLAEGDLQRLLDLTQQDSSLREEFETDANLNALLRFMTDGRQTEDQFVQGVLDQCTTQEFSGLPTPDLGQVDLNIEDLSAETVSDAGDWESTFWNDRGIALVATHELKISSAYRKRRRPSAWMACTVTAAAFACLAVVTWLQVYSPSRTDRKDSDSKVVQETVSESPTVKESNKRRTPRPVAAVENDPVQQHKATAGPEKLPAVEKLPMTPQEQNEAIAKHPRSESPGQFVTLTKFDDPVWERKSIVGDRLGSEIVRLFAGSVELTFDTGAVVTVDGPVEFRALSTGELELRRGRLLASVPREAIGFTVSTPTAKVVDLGTEFAVAVNDAGESDVQVHKGEVEVAPIAPDGEKFQKWRLLPDDFNRASFFARPRNSGPTPASASLQGRRGQFQGFVSIDGQTAEFSSPEAFDNVRRRVVIEFSQSEENALRQWKEFVNSMQNNLRGTMKVNGQEMQFGNLQDLMRLQHRMLENVQKAGSNSNGASFSGSINVNGRIISFKTREEYEAARRAAFGPAATFGIGDILGDQSGSR